MRIHGTRLIDLAARTKLRYPTAHRILQCLVKQGLVEKHLGTRCYSLGPLLYELGLAATPRTNLKNICEPFLSRLAEITGDTVFLNVRSGLDAVCIDRREGTFPIKALVYEIGVRRPLGVGAGGLALLMKLAWADIQQIVKDNATRLPSYGRLTSQAVLTALKRARETGYVVTSNVVVSGVTSVALPFSGRQGVPWAAVTVSSVSSRMPPSRQRELAALLDSEIQGMEKALTRSPSSRARAV